MPKRRPPSRLRYEAEHPTVTARIPAEVKAKLDEALQTEDLTFSEWVQARTAGHVADARTAYRRGYEKGQSDAGWGGTLAGMLAAHFRAEQGQPLCDPLAVVAYLHEHPSVRRLAEEFAGKAGHAAEFAALLGTGGKPW